MQTRTPLPIRPPVSRSARSGSKFLPLLLLVAALGALWLTPTCKAQDNLPAPRDQVHCITALDGDSLLVEWAGRSNGRFQIRLLGVDCPEKGQEFSNVARTMSRSFCNGRVLDLEYGPHRTDRYGRVLAYVWSDGKMLNEILVLQGLALAIAHDREEQHAQRLARAEGQARIDKTGFWSKGGLEMTPRRFRKLHRR
ncbi:MAG: thermonuclease family protein [Desulfovibrio sp.]